MTAATYTEKALEQYDSKVHLHLLPLKQSLLPLPQCWSPRVPRGGFSPELLHKVILSCFLLCQSALCNFSRISSQMYKKPLVFLGKVLRCCFHWNGAAFLSSIRTSAWCTSYVNGTLCMCVLAVLNYLPPWFSCSRKHWADQVGYLPGLTS